MGGQRNGMVRERGRGDGELHTEKIETIIFHFVIHSIWFRRHKLIRDCMNESLAAIYILLSFTHSLSLSLSQSLILSFCHSKRWLTVVCLVKFIRRTLFSNFTLFKTLARFRIRWHRWTIAHSTPAAVHPASHCTVAPLHICNFAPTITETRMQSLHGTLIYKS